MRTFSNEQTSGKCVPDMAQSIISLCSRTWNRERGVSVLHRSLEPHLSVWDCVPESIIDAYLKDAVLCYPGSGFMPPFADPCAYL